MTNLIALLLSLFQTEPASAAFMVNVDEVVVTTTTTTLPAYPLLDSGTVASGCNTSDGVGSLAFNVTTGSQSGRKLVVWIGVGGTTDSCPNDTSPPSGAPTATYNGVGLSYANNVDSYLSTTNGGTGRRCITTMYLDNPGIGTHQLSIAVGEAAGTPLMISAVAAVFYNAPTGDSPEGEGYQDGSGTKTATEMGIITQAANTVMVSGVWKGTTETPTLDTGMVSIGNRSCDGYRLDAAYETYTSGGTDTALFSWVTGTRVATSSLEW